MRTTSFMSNRISASCLFLACAVLPFSQSLAETQQPWRIDQLQLTPDWLSLSGQHRTRFETLDNQFRNNRDGGDQALVFRTTIRADVNLERVAFAAEMMDSRAALTDSGTPLNTGIVNPLELLQAYVESPVADLFSSGSKASLKGGRLTMDVGSRRLVARNRFRNTINGFTGIDWRWQSKKGRDVRLFYTFPVQRLVSGDIQDNDAKFDKEHEEVRFWGVYFSPAALFNSVEHEYYLFGLNEDDVDNVWETRNRNLYTPGLRFHKAPAQGQFHFELESALQFGESRVSTTSTDDLDHFAYFFHVEAGYSFKARWKPQLIIQYDYASGDDDPNDGDNNRFDTLFGARRFEFGPTGIFGAFARTNINTPGLRIKFKPARRVSSFVGVRAYWLASADDSWVTAGIANPPGQSDKYIGTQAELRVRWDVVPKNVRLEAGGAHLFAGDVMNNASKTDSSYLYSQIVLSF